VGKSGHEVSERVRGTHKLEGTDGWVSQDMQQASKGDSQTRKHRWVGKSGHRVSEQVRGTHKLDSTDGWVSQERE